MLCVYVIITKKVAHPVVTQCFTICLEINHIRPKERRRKALRLYVKLFCLFRLFSHFPFLGVYNYHRGHVHHLIHAGAHL